MNKGAIRIRGDFVGYIEGDAYYKEVYGSRHRLRVLNAWAFDADTMDKIIIPAVSEILVTDREMGKKYYSTIKNFVEHRGEITYGGHGRQYFLALKYWEVR